MRKACTVWNKYIYLYRNQKQNTMNTAAEVKEWIANTEAKRDEWMAKVEKVKAFVVENGICDEEPTLGYSSANGHSAYCMWHYKGEYYKVRISDHQALRSGEIMVPTAEEAILHIDRTMVRPDAYELQKVYSIERVEIDRAPNHKQECDIILFERVSKKGNLMYRVLAPKFTQREWVRIK